MVLSQAAAHSAIDQGAEDGARSTFTSAVFVGFDSAWADNKKAPGAICSVRFDGEEFIDFRPPMLVDFDGAFDCIQRLKGQDAPTLVALDQPTIVPNETGMRPAEKVAASLISWMGGGVQPANSGLPLFRAEAPIKRFLAKLMAIEDPEAARSAKRGLFVMEVFPALALASFDAGFFGPRKGPRYNPARRQTFRIEDWRAVVDAAAREAASFRCAPLVAWLDEQRPNPVPKKANQDRLDAALCLLIAIRWRLGARERSVAIGDLKSGYIVAPVSEVVMKRLKEVATDRRVPVNDLRRA
jgi:predicted RNase H-like nuclease